MGCIHLAQESEHWQLIWTL